MHKYLFVRARVGAQLCACARVCVFVCVRGGWGITGYRDRRLHTPSQSRDWSFRWPSPPALWTKPTLPRSMWRRKACDQSGNRGSQPWDRRALPHNTSLGSHILKPYRAVKKKKPPPPQNIINNNKTTLISSSHSPVNVAFFYSWWNTLVSSYTWLNTVVSIS